MSAALRRARHVVARARLGVAEAGVVETAYLGLQSLLPARWVGFAANALVVRPLPGPRALADPAARWGEPEDVERLEPSPARRALFRDRLAAGWRVWLLEQDGAVAAHAWYGTGTHEEDGLRVPLGPGAAWGCDAVVRRDLRGGGLGPRLMRSGSVALAEAGYDRLVMFVDLPNRAMHRVLASTGGEVRARVLVFRAGPVVVLRERRGRRVRWRAGRAPLPLRP